MQNRYTGDIGDFAKHGLLRALTGGLQFGIAWYLYPDESHNKDGRHTDYLDHPEQWRHLNPELLDALRSIVQSGHRTVKKIEDSGIFPDAVFSGHVLKFDGNKQECSAQRKKWFQATLDDLAGCDLVFADPDNGLRDDATYQHGTAGHWKSIPLSEALALAAGRTAIIYHHNTRFAGGHAKEIQHWLHRLGRETVALYWRKTSPRTFFVIHPAQNIRQRINEFVGRWSPHFELHTLSTEQVAEPKKRCRKMNAETRSPMACPECGHRFTGKGWSGIDAHWKANHLDIMPYQEAWPIIKSGGCPTLARYRNSEVI